MKKKRQKPENIRVRCPYCGRMARLHPASYVYGRLYDCLRGSAAYKASA